MSVFNSLINWYFKKRYQSLQDAIDNAVAIQKSTLVELIERAKDTKFGKEFNFSKIRDYKDFIENVPLFSYEQIFPYVDRMMNGEPNVLWPSEIKWFAKSSGTTNDRSKYIPVSNDTLESCHFEGGRDVISVYLNQNTKSKFFSGKGVLIGGSQNVNPLNEYTHYGDLSAVMMKHLPIWVHLFKTPHSSIAMMEDWEKKSTLMAEHTANENVTSISGVPTWTLVLFEKLLKKTGKSNMLEVWPNMELFIHGGVSFKPYREQFKKLFPGNQVKYLETYNASEGFFGLQTDLTKSEMALMVNYGVFFEFIPVSEYWDENPHTLPLWEVEKDVNYAVIISNNSGLWRYKLGDTIKFTSTEPYKFVITGRTRLFINVFGEELMIDNSDKAIEHACIACNALIKDYTAAPIYMDDPENASHEWLIEFEKEPDNIDTFVLELDSKLKDLNSDYAGKRHKDLILKMPRVRSVPKDTFKKWLESKNKLGGQHKVPRLWNDRTIIESINELIV